MQGVNHCDFSGIHTLEAIRRACLERGGDLFFMKLQPPVEAFMKSTGFFNKLGPDHFLAEDEAIHHLFHRVLDPAICIYECPFRAFKECQNLPKRDYPGEIPLCADISPDQVATISPTELWQRLRNGQQHPTVIDVREPREFSRGHVPQAELIPLPSILSDSLNLAPDEEIVLVCRSGRRSIRAAYVLQERGFKNIRILQGGILAWEAATLLEATEPMQ
jgi:SulP family sulfate permease